MHLQEKLFWEYYHYRREDDAWDYKREISISNKSGFADLAKDILAFANYGGGYILLGVEDRSHALIGVKTEIDPANLGNSIEKKLGFHLDVQLIYFDHQEGEKKIRLGLVYIPAGAKTLLSTRDLHKSDGTLVVQENAIYYRRNTRSIRASGDDIDRILRRISTGRTENIVALQDEPSALRRHRLDKFDFLRVLSDIYDPTAEKLGSKLREIWQFRTERSKVDFAQLLHIPPSDIDAYFDGRKMLDLSHLMAATKMFALPTDYFFRPTFDMRFAYWTEDLVKYAILSLVKPKAAIHFVDNDGKFYAKVLHELAIGICRLHDLLFSPEPTISHEFYEQDSSAAWYMREPIPDEHRSNLSKQYYKLLEQYPRKEDRSLVPQEHILRMWFYASDDYIARLIIEGIDRINVSSKQKFVVKLRFMKDLLNRKVRFRGYDADNLRMTK